MAEKKDKQALKHIPPQSQTRQPGVSKKMKPRPKTDDPNYRGSGKLTGKVALITGGDSGIGQAAAIAFAKEGAKLVIVYLEETEDAKQTQAAVEKYDSEALLIRTDIKKEVNCVRAVNKAVKYFGRLDIVVNNAAVQFPQTSLANISAKQLQDTFATNIFAQFYLTKAALPYLKKGAAIINTTSVTAYRGSAHLLDYSATKGAITSFTRSLSQSLAAQGIRVNAVAPGPVWTPLIPASFKASKVKDFGSDVPLGRAGAPYEIAPAFVFLASEDSAYMTGQVLHPNGGEVING